MKPQIWQMVVRQRKNCNQSKTLSRLLKIKNGDVARALDNDLSCFEPKCLKIADSATFKNICPAFDKILAYRSRCSRKIWLLKTTYQKP